MRYLEDVTSSDPHGFLSNVVPLSAGPHRAALQVAPHGEKRGGQSRERDDQSPAGICSKEKDADGANLVGSRVQCPRCMD
jgi:hypothetical protein